MTRAIDAAIAAQLRSDELANCVWWDKAVPEKDPAGTPITKYLRMRSNTGLRTTERLAGLQGALRKTVWLTGVGTSPGQAAWVLEQADDVLLNFTPTVPGWSCHRLVFAASQPVDVDPDIDNRFFGVNQYDLYAEPLPAP